MSLLESREKCYIKVIDTKKRWSMWVDNSKNNKSTFKAQNLVPRDYSKHTHTEAPAHTKLCVILTWWTNWGESVRLDVLPVTLPAGLGGWPVTERIAHITGHTTTTSTTTASTNHYWELIPIQHCCLTRRNTFTAMMSRENKQQKSAKFQTFQPFFLCCTGM